MASKLHIKDINSDQIKIIEKLLHFVPEIPKYLQNKYDYKPNQDNAVQFYRLSKPYLYLPLTFSRALFGRHVNNEREYNPVNIEFVGVPYEHQVEILNKSEEIIRNNHCLLLALHTGWGKTFAAAWLASKLGLVTCVLYHREKIGVQWYNTFKDLCNITPYVIDEKNSIPLDSTTKVILSMSTRVHKIPENIKNGVGFLIIDEAHCFCTPSAPQVILSFAPKYLLLETATPKRDDNMCRIIDTLVGDSRITVISEKIFHVFKVRTCINLEISTRSWKGKEVLDHSDYLTKYSQSEIRNNIICDIACNYKDRKMILLTERLQHANTLYGLLTARGEKVAILAGSIQTYSDSRILIGTISKIGTGFDEKNACPDFAGVRIDFCIICSSIKSPTRLEQCVGRAFRSESPVVFHLVDENPLAKRHWYECQKWYKSRNGEIQEIFCNS